MIAPSNPIVSIGPLLAVPGCGTASSRSARGPSCRVAHRRRRGAEGSGRSDAGRARPRGQSSSASPGSTHRPGGHPRDRRARRRPGRRGRGRGRCDASSPTRSCARRRRRRPGPHRRSAAVRREPARRCGASRASARSARAISWATIIADACAGPPNGPLLDGDVLVVTQKVVSKAEGRLVGVDPDDPLSHKALVEQEAARVRAPARRPRHHRDPPRLRLRQQRRGPVERRARLRRPAPARQRPVGPSRPRHRAGPPRRARSA